MVVTGGCLCGAVRFAYLGEVGPAGYCYCEDCRRCTGSAYVLSVRCLASKLQMEGAELRGFTKHGQSGQALTRHFCAACGSPIYTTSPRHPDFIYVKAGVFDEPAIVHPSYEAWTRSRVEWAQIPTDIESYQEGRT